MLLREDRTMCCLGFYSKQVGELDDSAILDKSYPYEVISRTTGTYFKRCPIGFEKLISAYGQPYRIIASGEELRVDMVINSGVAARIASINDDRFATETDREQRLKELFLSELDTEVEFIN